MDARIKAFSVFVIISIFLQGNSKPMVLKPFGKAFAGQNCQQGYQSAVERLNKENPARVVKTRSYDLTETYGKNTPLYRTYGISITVGGDNAKAHDVLFSTSILKEASQKILVKCPNVGLVSFGVYRTDWGRTFGVLGKDQIKEFDCISDLYPNNKGRRSRRIIPSGIDFPSGIDYKWGYTWC